MYTYVRIQTIMLKISALYALCYMYVIYSLSKIKLVRSAINQAIKQSVNKISYKGILYNTGNVANIL